MLFFFIFHAFKKYFSWIIRFSDPVEFYVIQYNFFCSKSPVVLGNHLPVWPDPLEVPHQLRVVDDSLAGEEHVATDGHVVRALGGDLRKK